MKLIDVKANRPSAGGQEEVQAGTKVMKRTN